MSAKKRKAPKSKARPDVEIAHPRDFITNLLGDMAGRAIQGAAEALFERTEDGIKTVLGFVGQAHETVRRPVKRKTKGAQEPDEDEELVGEVVEAPSRH